jgi:hypothetical protein
MEHLNKTRCSLVFIINLLFIPFIHGQSLLDELNADASTGKDTNYAESTFKATRLINGQSVETVGKGALNFVISHRFGNINTGIKDFFGIDESHIRIGLEYGLTPFLDVGIGRSREQKLVDGYLKYKIVRQSSGGRVMPVSVSWYSSVAAWTDLGRVPGRDYSVVNRLNYIHEVIIARKFNERMSVQVIPGFVHRNLTENESSPNIAPYTGVGGRFKILNRLTFNVEYYHNWNSYIQNNYYDPLSFGVDLETGGHIFQLHVSNVRAMQEKIMIPENTNNWSKGDFGFGFNIIRHFN